jgi:hypothetical protein
VNVTGKGKAGKTAAMKRTKKVYLEKASKWHQKFTDACEASPEGLRILVMFCILNSGQTQESMPKTKSKRMWRLKSRRKQQRSR